MSLCASATRGCKLFALEFRQRPACGGGAPGSHHGESRIGAADFELWRLTLCVIAGCGEVMAFNDLKEHGSENAVKAAGRYRQEGKLYEVNDGDVIFFKFNVTAPSKKK
eukprot:7128822-Pyramimonas_sp.AAC.1